MPNLVSVNHNIPKSIIRAEDVQAMVDKATKAGAERVVKMLDKTVENWDDKPVFVVKKSTGGYEVRYDGRTTGGKKFEWVSGGVKAHQETSAKGMVFEWAGRGQYPAKTHVGSLNSYKGITAKRGLPRTSVIRLYQLMHPGIWPRDFVGLIMKTEKDRVLKDIMKLVAGLPKQGMYGPRLER